MDDKIIKLLNENYKLNEIDVGEFKKMKVGPMSFNLSCYDADSLFKVSYMNGKALFGLMKMTTVVITSNKKDIPIFSYDRIEAGKKDVCILELYDTRQKKVDYPELEKVKLEFLYYKKYDLKPAWSDDIKLKESFSVCSKGANTFDILVKDLFKQFFKIIEESDTIDSDFKNKMNAYYVNNLLIKGGTPTEMFDKKLGKEKTEELYRKYLFSIE